MRQKVKMMWISGSTTRVKIKWWFGVDVCNRMRWTREGTNVGQVYSNDEADHVVCSKAKCETTGQLAVKPRFVSRGIGILALRLCLGYGSFSSRKIGCISSPESLAHNQL
jgi:hypothetical protein